MKNKRIVILHCISNYPPKDSELNLKNTFFAGGISDEFLVGFVSTVMTIMILLFSEIIPKTIGAKYWNKLAKFTTIFLSSIIPIFKYTGILWILQAFTKSIGASKKELFLKREDISTIAEIAKEEGIIEEKDSKFIKNIVKLRNVTLKEIMTPSSVMVTADENTSIDKLFYSKKMQKIRQTFKNKEEYLLSYCKQCLCSCDPTTND